MRKIVALSLFTIFAVTAFAGCGGEKDSNQGKDPEKPIVTEFPDQIVSFSLWDWNIATQEDAKSFADKIKEMGYTGADVTFCWKNLEQQKGVYDFTYIDSVLDAFAETDLYLGASLMYWTDGLNWRNELELQRLPDGTIYSMSGRGASVSLSDETSLNVMKNTYSAFTKHIYERYPGKIFRMHPRTSQYGELEYFCMASDVLDFGEPAIANFRAYLKETHESLEELNYAAAGNHTFASFEELDTIGGKELSETLYFDWQSFRQEECLKVCDMFRNVQKENAPEVPFALQIGCIWDQAASTRRGIVDPYLASKVCDILHTDDGPRFNHNFSIDYTDVDGTLRLASEIDGKYQPAIQAEIDGGDRTLTLYRRQATAMGQKGISYLNVANWGGEMNDWTEQLATLPTTFFNASETQRREEPDKSVVILINTADMFTKGVAAISLYANVHTRLSLNGEKQVRFVSDAQLLDNPELLDEIEKICVGYVYSDFTIRAELAALLKTKGKELTYDKNSIKDFAVKNEYGYMIAGEDLPAFIEYKI